MILSGGSTNIEEESGRKRKQIDGGRKGDRDVIIGGTPNTQGIRGTTALGIRGGAVHHIYISALLLNDTWPNNDIIKFTFATSTTTSS